MRAVLWAEYFDELGVAIETTQITELKFLPVIETDMILKMDKKIHDGIRAQIPIGRFGQPKEIGCID